MGKLNPWYIDVDPIGIAAIRINVNNSDTGEIRQILLTVDDIASISYLDVPRVSAIAEFVRNGDEQQGWSEGASLLKLDALVSYFPKGKECYEEEQ